MTVRFRIRTLAGQELSFATQGMFEDFVRSGDLSYDDLVYDAEDGSWAPARAHPIVLDIQYSADPPDTSVPGHDVSASTDDVSAPTDDASGPAEDASGLAEGTSGPTAEGPEDLETDADATPADESFGLELTAPEEVSPEEASRQFVEKMAAERASELEHEGSRGSLSLTTPDASTVGGIAPRRANPLLPAAGGTPAPRSYHRGPVHWDTRPTAPTHRTDRGSAVGSQRGRQGGSREAATGSAFGAAVIVSVLGAGGYLGFALSQTGAAAEPGPDEMLVPIRVEPAPEPAPPEPVIAQTEAAVRERARERFLGTTQEALRSLVPIPSSWPGGRYLALPSASPDVPRVWTSYLATVEQVRLGDGARYRSAVEAALDDAMIDGEDRTIWLERAVADFEGSAAARAAHYDRVEALAVAAVRSHQALLEAEGLVIWDGPEEGLMAGEIGAGVTARDPESSLLLGQVVDLLTAALDAEGHGPGAAEYVRAWVWDGYLDAVTN